MKSLLFRHLEPSQRRVQDNLADPDGMQQYVDYMILDPSQSSVRMQAPLLDPNTYRQVGGDPFKTHKSRISFFYFSLLKASKGLC